MTPCDAASTCNEIFDQYYTNALDGSKIASVSTRGPTAYYTSTPCFYGVSSAEDAHAPTSLKSSTSFFLRRRM